MKRTTFELDWPLIEEAADALGVSVKALEKWREREKVPHKWRIPIILWAKGKIPLDAFE